MPSAVGAPGTLLYYSGDKTVFQEFETTLRVRGGAAVQARGLEASSMVRFAGKWLDMIRSLLPVYAKEIDSADYADVRRAAEAGHGDHSTSALTEMLRKPARQ